MKPVELIRLNVEIEHRRHGHARRAVAAWAANVVAGGRVAFFSHRIDNVASEALARSLGVVLYAESTGYS